MRARSLLLARSAVPSYLLPQGFTQDQEVQGVVRQLSGLLALSIFPHCTTIAIEALLLNSKDIEFLGQTHVLTCAVWAVFLKWQGRNWPVRLPHPPWDPTQGQLHKGCRPALDKNYII